MYYLCKINSFEVLNDVYFTSVISTYLEAKTVTETHCN